MKKLLLIALMLSTLIYADEEYLCHFSTVSKDGQELSRSEARAISKSTKEKVTIKTTWYGKPIYMILYQNDGVTVEKMIKNTQTKTQWVQSDELHFKTKEGNGDIEMIMGKGETPTYSMIATLPTGETLIVKFECFKQ